ncbi:MAG: ATP-binding protein [Bacteroidia bacterium]
MDQTVFIKMKKEDADINFRLLFESAPGLFLILKPDAPHFTIAGASDAYLAATMTERKKIVGHSLFKIFPDNPDDKTADGSSNLLRSLETVLKTKAAHTMPIQKYDIPRPLSEGGGFEERYWSPHNAPVFNDKNEIEYIIHRAEDVTESALFKKHSIEEIQTTRDRLEEQDNLIEEKDNLLNENQERINAILEVLIKYTSLDFSRQVKLSPKGDELDAIAMGLNTLSAELESYIKQLQQSEEKFEKAFSLNPAGITLTNITTGKWVEVNESFERMTGYEREELLGKSSSDLDIFSKDERKKILVELEKKGSVKNYEVYFKKKNGEKGSAIFSNEPILISGKPHVISILYDITAKKEAEKKVQKLNRELQTNFVQLESVNKELESFSYSVSHDLRAPLRAIDGYAGILEEDYGKALDNEGKRILEAVKYNAKKMGSLIDDLLAFSRLGKKELVKTDINMNQLMEGALYDLNKSIKHSAKVKIKHLSPARGDYGLLSQVAINLLSNAIKYSSKVKDPAIEISSEQNDKETIYTIKDNGAGFDMKYVNKLFGVFQRLHTMEEFDGTGVGLAIVQRIMAKHGGKVWAEGEKNKGATFRFSLPKK